MPKPKLKDQHKVIEVTDIKPIKVNWEETILPITNSKGRGVWK